MPAFKQAILSALMVASVFSAAPATVYQDWSPNGLNMTQMRYYVTAFRGIL